MFLSKILNFALKLQMVTTLYTTYFYINGTNKNQQIKTEYPPTINHSIETFIEATNKEIQEKIKKNTINYLKITIKERKPLQFKI